jgi:hypothetical protein
LNRKKITQSYHDLVEFQENFIDPAEENLRKLKEERKDIIVRAYAEGTAVTHLSEATRLRPRRIYYIIDDHRFRISREQEEQDRLEWKLSQYADAVKRELNE